MILVIYLTIYISEFKKDSFLEAFKTLSLSRYCKVLKCSSSSSVSVEPEPVKELPCLSPPRVDDEWSGLSKDKMGFNCSI